MTVALEEAAFQPQPAAVVEARRFIQQALMRLDGRLPAEGVAVLVLAANEIVVNAVLHARTEFTVRIRLHEGGARVEVEDGNSRMLQPCMAPPDATSGRGLAIVDGLGLKWGSYRLPGGKVVWIEAPLG